MRQNSPSHLELQVVSSHYSQISLHSSHRKTPEHGKLFFLYLLLLPFDASTFLASLLCFNITLLLSFPQPLQNHIQKFLMRQNSPSHLELQVVSSHCAQISLHSSHRKTPEHGKLFFLLQSALQSLQTLVITSFLCINAIVMISLIC